MSAHTPGYSTSFLQGFLRLERSGQKDDKFGNPARTGDFQQGSNLGANRAQADSPVLRDARRSQAHQQGGGDLRVRGPSSPSGTRTRPPRDFRRGASTFPSKPRTTPWRCVTTKEQHDLDRLGIAKTAREEKIRASDAKLKEQAENQRMMKLCRQHVLKEQPGAELVQIGGIQPAAPASRVEEQEEVGSFGD